MMKDQKKLPSFQALNQLVGSFLKGVNICFRSLIDSLKEFSNKVPFIFDSREYPHNKLFPTLICQVSAREVSVFVSNIQTVEAYLLCIRRSRQKDFSDSKVMNHV